MSNAHAFQKLSLWHGTFSSDIFIRFRHLTYLLEVNIGRKIYITDIIEYFLVIFDQLVVLQASERIREAVIFTIINY